MSPQAIQAIDPLGIGVNPNVISFLNGGYWPHANSAASGDGLNTLGYVFSSPISLIQDWYIAKVDYNVTQGRETPNIGVWGIGQREQSGGTVSARAASGG